MDSWPFDDPPNVVTITVAEIMRKQRPILLVCHDVDDGAWQFLTGDAFNMKDAMLVGLSEIVEIDASILELADLPYGWKATRSSIADPWVRSEEQILG